MPLDTSQRDQPTSGSRQLEAYVSGRHTIVRLYAVLVLAAFDATRNCSHCRWDTDDDCKAWQEAKTMVSAQTQEFKWLVKGVDGLREATGGRTANIYQFPRESVAYFAPDAPIA